MSLEYYLQPNPVTPDPNDQSARVATRGNLTEDDLAAELVKRGTVTSKAQGLAVITGLHELIAEFRFPAVFSGMLGSLRA